MERTDGPLEAEETQPEEQQESARPGSRRLFMLLAVLAGIGVGSVTGFSAVGRMVAPRAASEHGEKADSSGDHGRKGGHGEGAEIPLHSVENVVVNPLSPSGIHFLVVSVALELDEASTAQSLATRDPLLRDAVIRLLGSKTVEELSDITRRDALKEELRRAAEGVVGQGKVQHVYLPQFVIQ